MQSQETWHRTFTLTAPLFSVQSQPRSVGFNPHRARRNPIRDQSSEIRAVLLCSFAGTQLDKICLFLRSASPCSGLNVNRLKLCWENRLPVCGGSFTHRLVPIWCSLILTGYASIQMFRKKLGEKTRQAYYHRRTRTNTNTIWPKVYGRLTKYVGLLKSCIWWLRML